MSNLYNMNSPPFAFSEPSSLQPNQGSWAQTTLRNLNRLNLPNNSAGSFFPIIDSSASSASQTYDDHTVINILMMATESNLMRAQNPAFMNLYNKAQMLESQLCAQRELVAELKSMLRSRPTSVSTSSNQDATSANKLTIPSLPPDCNRRDFEDVKFWTRGDWQRHQKSCEERGKDYKKLDFLTDADGQPIDDDRIDSMTKHARLLWNSLYKEREDPDTWGVRSMFASGYFGNHMQIKYPEFQWCEGDWKVHAFATIRFPDWSQDVRRRGRLTRSKPSISKRKAEDEETHRKEKKKKRRKNEALAPNINIINLTNETSATSMSSANTIINLTDETSATSESSPNTIINLTDETSATSESSPNTIQPTTTGSNSTESVATASVSDPHTRARPRPAYQSATIQNQPTQTSSTDCTSPMDGSAEQAEDQVGEQANENDVTGNSSSGGAGDTAKNLVEAAAINEPSRSIQDPSNATVVGSESVAIPSGDISSRQEVETAATTSSGDMWGQEGADLFSNLEIPAPSVQIPQITAPRGSASVWKSKKGKVMIPTDALTPRNLFAIDYMKDHPGTTVADFKVVFNSIDKETKKKYDALAKQKKAEQSAAKSS